MGNSAVSDVRNLLVLHKKRQLDTIELDLKMMIYEAARFVAALRIPDLIVPQTGCIPQGQVDELFTMLHKLGVVVEH